MFFYSNKLHEIEPTGADKAARVAARALRTEEKLEAARIAEEKDDVLDLKLTYVESVRLPDQ